jgi:tight adherence protein C
VEWILSMALTTACIVSVAAALGAFQAHDAARTRLQRAAGTLSAARSGSDEGWLATFSKRAGELLERLFPDKGLGPKLGSKRTTRQRLIEAGLRRASAVPAYLGSRVVTAAGLTGAAFPLSIFQEDPRMAFGVLIAAGGVGYTLPSLFIDAQRRRRQRQIVRTLPDAIDLMVVCVEAGLSLAATIDRVAREFAIASPILSGELRLSVLETQAGKSLSDALRALGSRNGVQDLTSLTSALIQTERMGTRVADTLRVQADALRTRRIQRAEEVAQRAPVKMLFPAGVFIFPALLAVTLAPAFLGTSRLFGE